MLLISENVEIAYFKANQEHKLIEAINHEKKYRISDTRLSYRQANDLGSNNLLTDDKESKSSWRKFSYKELVYVDIVVELKEFGLKREQLKPLWEAFFREPPQDKKQIDLNNKTHGEIALGCALCGIEMNLIIDGDGKVFFYDPFYTVLFSFPGPHIKISLNEVINRLNPQINLDKVPATFTARSLIFNHKNFSVTSPKERELLKIIRDRNFSAIKVKKKDGELATVYAEKHTGEQGLTLEDLVKMLKTKEYINIEIKQRDGKIVNFKVEETIKL